MQLLLKKTKETVFFPNNRVPICAILIKHRFVSINKILIVGKTSVQSLVFKDK